MTISRSVDEARSYLAGTHIQFEEADKLWRQLKNENEISLARSVLARLRDGEGIMGGIPSDWKMSAKLCQQHAVLTSKDPALGASVRHEAALKILKDFFHNFPASVVDGDGETFGIAGGICKRKWMDEGQLRDLQCAAEYYDRGAQRPVGDDGYPHINVAFVKDLLAYVSGAEVGVREETRPLRIEILEKLTPLDKVTPGKKWWNGATRAEALFGLGRYEDAAVAIAAVVEHANILDLQTTTQQFATLAHLHTKRPLDNPEILAVFKALLPSDAVSVRSALIGKVGLALSGGGFRASFYHLGVLARLAELDVLRHIDVLSCVSGGSIVGACYWLMLRNRLLEKAPLSQDDYVTLVQDLIKHFTQAVRQNLRGQVNPSKIEAGWRFFTGDKGAIDTEETAKALHRYFYAPLWEEDKSLEMHHLSFTPKDHDSALTRSDDFHPGKHNWLRKDRVPALVLNATTVNTGHNWQFTPTWMGESPWTIHRAADSVPRLESHRYVPDEKWSISLGRAVAASACVPGIFEPLRIDGVYEGYKIQLIDGGVYDNQGTVTLLAHNCTVLLVSDAAGQLLLEQAPDPGIAGLVGYALRAQDALMERIRGANYADLEARVRTRLIRGLMFLHMKDGLDADPIRTKFSQESYGIKHETHSKLGVRKDFQKAVAELRTDLDVFTDDEAHALMACGYQMAKKRFETDLQSFRELYEDPTPGQWLFADMLKEVRSTETATPRRRELIDALRAGRKRKI